MIFHSMKWEDYGEDFYCKEKKKGPLEWEKGQSIQSHGPTLTPAGTDGNSCHVLRQSASNMDEEVSPWKEFPTDMTRLYLLN